MPTHQPGPSEAFLVRSWHVQSRRRWRKLIEIIVLVSLAALAGAILFRFGQNTRVAEIRYVWVQMMPDERGGGRLLRAVLIGGDHCPTIKEDDTMVVMQRRAPPARVAFPVLLCEAVIRENSKAWINSRVLPARPSEPNDIVVIGDTGCRVTYYSQDQSCLDENEWPFKKNASNAAEKASGNSFVLHLGDFHYREHPCADSSSRCGGSPYGDNWQTWETEFFEPARQLLLAAPWVMMRGNHEDCNRAGAGWLFFFGFPAQPNNNKACEDDLATYTIRIGQTEGDERRPRSLVVMDTSNDKSPYGRETRNREYLKSLKFLDNDASEIWLALHQPLWLRNMNGFQNGNRTWAGEVCVNLGEEESLPDIRKKFEADQTRRLARLVLSGDTHAFQFFRPKSSSMPIQLVAGNGGTQLDKLLELAKPDATCPEKGEDGKVRIEARKSSRPAWRRV